MSLNAREQRKQTSLALLAALGLSAEACVPPRAEPLTPEHPFFEEIEDETYFMIDYGLPIAQGVSKAVGFPSPVRDYDFSELYYERMGALQAALYDGRIWTLDGDESARAERLNDKYYAFYRPNDNVVIMEDFWVKAPRMQKYAVLVHEFFHAYSMQIRHKKDLREDDNIEDLHSMSIKAMEYGDEPYLAEVMMTAVYMVRMRIIDEEVGIRKKYEALGMNSDVVLGFYSQLYHISESEWTTMVARMLTIPGDHTESFPLNEAYNHVYSDTLPPVFGNFGLTTAEVVPMLSGLYEYRQRLIAEQYHELQEEMHSENEVDSIAEERETNQYSESRVNRPRLR